MNNKPKFQIFIITIFLTFFIFSAYGGIATKTSAPFLLDTRDLNPIPEDGWQVVSNIGNTYNEDIVIDNFGKVWVFYYETPGANQPVYMKIFKSDAHLYLYRTLVGHGSFETEPRLNSIRAELNPATGDVWVALQGDDGGYFVVFDSTGQVKKDSTLLATNAFLPKLAIDNDGKVWFSWHTSNHDRSQSQVMIATYNSSGNLIYEPKAVSKRFYVFNTDIAIDDSERVWVDFELNENNNFSTILKILNNNGETYKTENIVSTNELILNPKRAFFSDKINQRMWLMEKNNDFDYHNFHLFALDGTQITSIGEIGTSSFLRNELNQIEFVRFNHSDSENQIYEQADFNPFTGDAINRWHTLFDSTYQFVQHCVAYNRNVKSLKVYLVNEKQNLTRMKFLTVETGFPQISVSPTTINFDTTKIKASYAKIREITVQNIGNEILHVESIQAQNSQFSVSDTSFSLLPQQSKIVEIRFSPADTNAVKSNIEIVSDDDSNSPFYVSVSGKGYLPTNPKIIVSPPTLIFDEVVIGSEQSLFVYVQNNDKYEALQISSIAHSDTQFVVDKNEFTVLPRQGQYVNVVFRPVIAAELITDSLIIKSNDPDTSNFIVPIFASSRAPLKPEIAVSPDSLYFGEIAVGEKKTIAMGVTNRGESALEISGINSNNSQFTVDTTEFVVTAQNLKYVNVTFAPQTEGTINGQLTISSNDETHPELNVPVVGVGKMLSDPYLVYDKTELNFGKIQQGDTLQKFILLQNFGDRILKVFHFYNGDSAFQSLASDTIRIEKEQSYYLWVRFAPQDTMAHNDVLNFATNDPNNQFVEINLVGKGEPNAQQLIVSFSEINFGTVLIHSQAKDSILVSNIGNRTLTVSNILSTNSHFRPGVTFFNIGPEATKKVYINFKPDSIKQFAGQLIIVSNDPVADSIFVQLNGTGRDSTNQHLRLSSDSLNFGEVARDNAKIMSLVINNKGERKLNITNIFNSEAAFSPTQTELTILGNSFQTVYVNFEPTESVKYVDTLKIVSNDPENDTSLVILSGKGREPLAQKMAVSDTILDFGSVALGRSLTKYITVFNTGEKKLSVFNVAVNDSQFQLANDWFILEPGKSKYLSVTYLPNSELQTTAALILESNDPEKPQVTITLLGRGTIYEGPEAVISPDNLDFGKTFLGAEKQLVFKIYNRSQSSSLHITNYSLANSMYKIVEMPNSVAASDSGFIRVAYQPLQEGNHYGSLTIFTNDVYNEQISLMLYGSGVSTFPAQNTLSQLGWSGNGSSPFGDGYSIFGGNYTADVLSNKNEKALFIKDIYLYEIPESQNTYMNLSFKNRITIIINNTMVFDSTDTNLKYWNKSNLDVSPYLTLGRNRIAVVVRTNNNSSGNNGGFDCEMFVNGQPKIRRGDQNWNQPDALWWYFYPVTTIPADNINGRLWFASDYALDFADSIKARWSFEPTGSDTIYDSSVFGRRAILHNVQWIDGITGKAMQFSGSDNSYAEIESNLNELPLNIEMWLNCYDARSYRQVVFSNKLDETENGNGLFIAPDLRLGVYFYNGEYIFPNYVLEPGAWHLISVQYGYDQEAGLNFVTVFVDGDSVGYYNYQPNYPLGPANKFYIGGVPQIQSVGFYGAIDELTLKNKVSGAPPVADVAAVDFVRSSNVISKIDTMLTFKIAPTPFKILSGELTLFHGGETPTTATALVDTNFWSKDSVYSSGLTIKIPSNYLDVRGLYFSLLLRTNWGGVRFPVEGFHFLRYRTAYEASNLTLAQRHYRMVSVPYELQESNLRKVLENFGGYDPYRWRLFDWEQTDTTYVEFSDTTQDSRWKFERGKAFWLVTDGEKDFVGGTGVTPENQDYRIVLTPGWNMVGNPFPYTIPFSMISATDDNVLQGPFYYQSSDSIGWLPPERVTYCQPWEGYFIWNGDSVNQTIIVPAMEDNGLLLPKPIGERQYFAKKYPDASFIIEATAVCGKYFDKGNLFGAAKKAAKEFDHYDSPEVPEISNHISLWANNFHWKKRRGAYRIDFQKDGENGYSWQLALDCQVPGAKSATLSFREIKKLPANWQIYLFDVDEDIAYNLNERKDLSLPIQSDDGMVKHFKLVVGDEKYIQQNSEEIPLVPVEFALKQNYPNPFNGVTTIEFSLPRRMNVKVQIYNILGQSVKTLVNGTMRGGVHQLHWDGKNQFDQFVPSGMYFVKITGERKATDVKKILLLK
ncbi:MAG: choice-of-anchor D domain-containing protein [Calditrichaeota bacterium]|nr:choice-of-anchor D domain-containing protein [Calditrichota bacterium]